MKIGIDARKLGPTGIGRYVTELVLAMVKQSSYNEYHLFILPEEKAQRLSGIKNIHLHRVDIPYFSFQEQFKFGDIIDSQKLDFIHVPNFNAPFNLKTPLVATVQDLTLLKFPGRKMWPGKRLIYRTVLNRTLNHAQKIIVGSNDTKHDLLEYVKKRQPKLAAKIAVIHHGVSTTFLTKQSGVLVDQILQSFSLVNPYLLIVGAQFKHKNISRTLAAFEQLVKENNLPHKVVICSAIDTFPKLVAKQISKSKALSTRVQLIGSVSDNDLHALYTKAEALVFTSLKEGFGIPLLEAMATGCTIITSKISAMPEVAGKAAFYVDPYEVESIKKAMKKVITGPLKDKQAKIKLGLKRVQDFSWDQSAKDTLALYNQIKRHV